MSQLRLAVYEWCQCSMVYYLVAELGTISMTRNPLIPTCEQKRRKLILLLLLEPGVGLTVPLVDFQIECFKGTWVRQIRIAGMAAVAFHDITHVDVQQHVDQRRRDQNPEC